VKIARSAPRPSSGLPELLVAIHTSRQSCSRPEELLGFANVDGALVGGANLKADEFLAIAGVYR